MWNLLCWYNNIYDSLHKYLKEKKKKKTQTNYWGKKEKKRESAPHSLNKPKKHYLWDFGSFYIVNRYASLHKYLQKKTQINNWKKKKKL